MECVCAYGSDNNKTPIIIDLTITESVCQQN